MNSLVSYNSEMKKSLMDKIFFVDKTECTRFLDYGCADGSMIKFLSQIYPENFYFGYDKSQAMVNAANANFDMKKVMFSSQIEDAVNFAEGMETALTASSILHEIYDAKLQDVFWGDVQQIKPKYLIIRDLCVSRFVNRMSDPTSVAKIYQRFDTDLIEKWENRWGNLYDNRSLVHFLLKYRFTLNWDTEFQENYLPYTYEQLLHSLPKEYTVVFNEHYTLHYVKSNVKKDFDIDLQDRTHVKLILQRKS